jgi:hypothetical protein
VVLPPGSVTSRTTNVYRTFTPSDTDYRLPPLWTAVFNSHGDGTLIRLLRDRGADPRAENSRGQSPLGLARLIANYPVAAFFADLE